jgi:hypothetical protein
MVNVPDGIGMTLKSMILLWVLSFDRIAVLGWSACGAGRGFDREIRGPERLKFET